MSTSTPRVIRRAIADDRLLDTARTRRQLTDTALIATGGGVLSELSEDTVDRELWRARIRRQDGRDVQVHLDRRLGTVVVQDLRGGATRAA
ncbi:MAG: hypothetical protein JWO02_3978 [Solirubrobacterales bacterium]|nr:hypothetical protein [Solirubrobacterales bacterium]